jgi:hypothetical protein
MTPKCCENCTKKTKTGDCRGGHHTSCGPWLAWFYEQWGGIRQAAQKIKQKKEEAPKE